MARGSGHGSRSWCSLPTANAGQDRTLESDVEEPNPARKLLFTWRSRSQHRQVRRLLQSPALPRELEESHASRRLLWTGSDDLARRRKDQTKDNPEPPLAASNESRLKSQTR